MLEFRLRMLEGFVDFHVIVEANVTHSGQPKPFALASLLPERFAWAKDRIIYLPIEFDVSNLNVDYRPAGYEPDSPHFKLENGQRNALSLVARQFAGTDILMISDADEIPSRELLTRLRNEVLADKDFPFACQQHMFYYSLKWLTGYPWYGTVVTTFNHLQKMTPQGHRDKRASLPRFTPGGWHLSYFKTVAEIQRKLQSFAHQEFNRPEFVNADHVTYCMTAGRDIIDSAYQFRTVGDVFFPDYFRQIAKSFPQWAAKHEERSAR
jgi:beta-1,4-mannosyl-glycoprotein beta-1,4-N-acetylglucosaminyltransferase